MRKNKNRLFFKLKLNMKFVNTFYRKFNKRTPHIRFGGHALGYVQNHSLSM